MSNALTQIADLEARRTAIRTAASGRWLTEHEREQVRLLTKALSDAWELRRMELARQPSIDHELNIVRGARDWGLGTGRAIERSSSPTSLQSPASSPKGKV